MTVNNKTVQDVLSAAQQQLEGMTETALLDVKLLLAHVLQKDVTWLATWSDKLLDSSVIAEFEDCVKRRQQGEPVAYILGYHEFWSLRLNVNSDVLIPRPDTETLVKTVLAFELPDTASVLDLGTGSGAIALALASEKPDWNVTAIDYSNAALAVAAQNAQLLQLGRVQFIQSNWFDAFCLYNSYMSSNSELSDRPVTSSKKRFDVIASNPPYIEPEDNHLSYLVYEPMSALIAEDKGLSDIKTIVQGASQFLKLGGYLIIEHGYKQHLQVQEIMRNAGFVKPQSVKDLGGNWRCTFAANTVP